MNPKTTLGAFALMTVVAMGATAPASGAETTSTVSRLATAHSAGTAGSLSSGQALLGSGNSHFNGNPVTIQTTYSGGLYSLNDPTRPGMGCGRLNGPVFTKTTDTWGNGTGTSLETACVDVMFAAQKHWDMLRNWLGRNGVDGACSLLPGVRRPEQRQRLLGRHPRRLRPQQRPNQAAHLTRRGRLSVRPRRI